MSRSWSISLRLTFWFGGIFFFGWLLFGVAMWLNLRTTLVNERYGTLARREHRLEKLLSSTQDRSDVQRQQNFAEFARATGNGLCEVFRADGSRAYPSPTPDAQEFPWPAMGNVNLQLFQQVSWAGQSYWVLGHEFSLEGQQLYVMAAAPESGNELVLSRFLTGLLASIPIILLISSAGGYFLSRRALVPVDRITASARTISITSLSARLAVVNTGDELQRLSETCNEMLERLESAVNRITQFTADASHDLRGPISFVRTVAEVAQRNPAIDPESRQAFADIVDESAKASLLLEDLLTLARADAGKGEIVLSPVNLASVVQEACEMARPFAKEKQHTLSVNVGSGRNVSILGDFASLRRLLWILLDNALKYTPVTGRIDVTLSTSDREALVSVRDDGIGIPEADLPHVFDRFYRADPSRSQVEGSGLGLSIAKWIAEMHQAGLAVVSTEKSGTMFSVKFPLHRNT
jgi:heavy metal sensor kinase